MARLKNNGEEIARLVKYGEPTEDVVERRSTISIRSNGRIMGKYDVVFKETDGTLRKHSYGWKRGNKIKPGVSLERVIEFYEQQDYERL